MHLENVCKALRSKGYTAHWFASKEEAADFIAAQCSDLTIGLGDSFTMEAMDLESRLAKNNTVINPRTAPDDEVFLRIARECMTTDVFLTSANGMTEDGVIVNLDGTGNRVAGSLFGHKKMYYVIGRNKIEPTLERAIWRTRNIAAPKNAQRLHYNTPCAVRGDKCYDCNSAARICNALLIQLHKVNDMEEEVILIDEDLGL